MQEKLQKKPISNRMPISNQFYSLENIGKTIKLCPFSKCSVCIHCLDDYDSLILSSPEKFSHVPAPAPAPVAPAPAPAVPCPESGARQPSCPGHCHWQRRQSWTPPGESPEGGTVYSREGEGKGRRVKRREGEGRRGKGRRGKGRREEEIHALNFYFEC